MTRRRRRAREEEASRRGVPQRAASQLRFVEVPETTASAVARAGVDVAIGFTAGTAATWVLLLVAAIVFDEALWDLERATGFDEFFRLTVPALFVLGPVLALAIPTLSGVAAAQSLRLLERHAAQHPDAVPSWAQESRIAILPARYARRAVLTIAVVAMAVGGFALLFGLFDDEGRGQPAVWAIVVVSVVAVLGWLVVRVLLQAAEEEQDARRVAIRAPWQRLESTTEAMERRRREALPVEDPPALLRPRAFARLETALIVAAVATGVSVVAWFASVWLRQPCRRCDEQYYDEPVERFIDGLSLYGGIAIAVCGAIVVLLTAAFVIVRRIRERTAFRQVADGRPRWWTDDAALPLLLRQRAGRMTTWLVAGGIAPPALWVAAVVVSGFEPEWADASAVRTAGVVAAVVAIAASGSALLIATRDARAAAVERNALRTVFSPGDPDLKEIAEREAQARRARRAAARAARRGQS
ncbi:hypothetical protein [Agromyces sp. LHK192]|uniref:hypothetical protein n=1 Tax=Agromyces sp. LHK192 TaxID=2498704 RepID=UPI000FD7AF58|nr:hypothetical protein [Agromyces sp. LHK192]